MRIIKLVSLIILLPLMVVSKSLGYKFGITSVLGPCLGFMFGGTHIVVLLVIASFIKGCIGMKFFTFGIPTIAGALCLSKDRSFFLDVVLKVVIPFVSMIIFWSNYKTAYPLFWFIPIVIFVLERFNIKSTFSLALASTFVSHAVGSVIYMYTYQTRVELWDTLVGVVLFERLMIASFIAIMSVIFNYNFKRYKIILPSFFKLS